MNWIKREWVLVATVWMLSGLCTSAWAGARVNPFDGIVERNPFGLKPPLPPVTEPAVPQAPPPPRATVEVTGITDILSSKRALLEIIPGPGKPVMRRIALEGDRFESVEVVSINLEKNEVVLRNGGVITNVPLKVAKSSPLPATPEVKPVLLPTQNAYNNSGRSSVMMGGPVPRMARPPVPLLPGLPQADRSFQ